MIKLRPYQKNSIDAVISSWNKGGSPVVVLPCGAGKSLVIAGIIEKAHNKRVLVLAHNKELLVQNESELRRMLPNADTGFFSAGLGMKHYNAQITFANIQSIASKIHLFDPFDIVCVDEAHRISPDKQTQYGETLTTLRQMNPHLRLAGLSATPYRMKQGYIHEGDDALFDEIAYEVPIQKLIDRGYLVPVIARSGKKVASMEGVKRSMGEFVTTQMADRFTEDILESACEQIVHDGKDRRAWIVFCANVGQANYVLTRMRSLGVDAKSIFGSTNKADRDNVVNDFKNGRLKCLVNVGTMTTGFNAPICDLVALLRATDSPSLYVQIVGRSMRTHPGKENALLLDFGGNVMRNGPIDNVIVKSPGSGDGVPPVKICPGCRALVAASARACQWCGFNFPEPAPNIEDRAFNGAVLASQIKPEEFSVLSTRYAIHKKEGKPDSVRVEYVTGDEVIREWFCPEHTGFARVRSGQVVKSRYGISMPATSNELLASLVALDKQPVTLKAIKNKQFYKVIGLTFAA